MTSAADRAEIIKLVDEAVANGARQFRACEELEITTRTYQRWSNPETPNTDQRPVAVRPTPRHKLSEEEKQEIIETVNQPEFASKPPSQIVPILADRGQYIASESSFYRVLHENSEQNHRGRAQKPESKPPACLCATGRNQIWSWDITYLNGPIKGLYYYLYLMIDIFTRDIMGWEVWEEETSEHASQLIRKAVLRQGIQSGPTPLVLHSDNGSPMKGATMLATLYELGVTPSRSRPSVSNDNPYSESIFKTCKYRPEFPVKGFASLEDARKWCLHFVNWYRTEHRHSAIQFITPGQYHNGMAEEILEKRRNVYEDARARNPLRWKRHTRLWKLDNEVWLNKPQNDLKNLRQLS